MWGTPSTVATLPKSSGPFPGSVPGQSSWSGPSVFLQHRISLVGDTEVWAKLMKHMGLGAGGMADTRARFSPPWTTVTTGLSLPGLEREAWGEQICASERLSPTRPGGDDDWHCRPLCCLCQTSPADPGH